MKRIIGFVLIFSFLTFTKAQTFSFYLAPDKNGEIKTNLYRLPKTEGEIIKVNTFELKYGIKAVLSSYKKEDNTYLRLEVSRSSFMPDTVIEVFYGNTIFTNNDFCLISVNTNNGVILTKTKSTIYGQGYSYNAAYHEVMQIEDYDYNTEKNFFCVYSLYSDLRQSTPIATVLTFLTSLDNRKFRIAFQMQKVSSWGNYNHFSSKKGFGGIQKVSVDTIYIQSQTATNAEVFVSATYYDPVNNDLKVKEIFKLQKIQNKWYITGLKIKDYAFFGTYSSDNGVLNVKKLTKSELQFSLYYINDPNKMSIEQISPGGHAEGTAFKQDNYYIFVADECKIYFTVSADKKKIIVNENGLCSELRCKTCKFEAEFVKY